MIITKFQKNLKGRHFFDNFTFVILANFFQSMVFPPRLLKLGANKLPLTNTLPFPLVLKAWVKNFNENCSEYTKASTFFKTFFYFYMLFFKKNALEIK